MYTILGSDGKEYGPVSQEQILTWLAENRVDRATSCKRQGEADWHRVGDMSEFASYQSRTSTPSDTMTLINMEQLEAADPVVEDYSVDLGLCMSRGFELLKKNYWLCFGAVALVILSLILINAPGIALRFFGIFAGMISPALSMPIMVTGSLLQIAPQILLGQVFEGSLYLFFFRLMRGQPAVATDGVLAGFRKPYFGSLVILGLLMTLIFATAVFIPIIVSLAVGFVLSLPFGGMFQQHPSAGAVIAFVSCMAIGILAALCIVYYFFVGYLFAPMLIVDRNMGGWQAMEYSRKIVNKHWWWMFAIFIVLKLLAAFGFMACYIGYLFTAPFYYAAIVYAYHDIFYKQKPS